MVSLKGYSINSWMWIKFGAHHIPLCKPTRWEVDCTMLTNPLRAFSFMCSTSSLQIWQVPSFHPTPWPPHTMGSCVSAVYTKFLWFIHQFGAVFLGFSVLIDLFNKGLILWVAWKMWDCYYMGEMRRLVSCPCFFPSDINFSSPVFLKFLSPVWADADESTSFIIISFIEFSKSSLRQS